MGVEWRRVPVIDVDNASVKPPPDLGGQMNTEYIRGLAAVSEHMVMLLDIDRLIVGDVGEIAATPDAAAA